MAGDLKTARIVYDELVSLHIGILRRNMYLAPAISCIDGTQAGLEAFLFWFNLVPNRPAMRAHTAFKSAYAPLVDRLLSHHSRDARSHVQVLLAAAQKGVLPAIYGPIVRHLAFILAPATLEHVTESVWQTFIKHTTSHASARASSSARASAHQASATQRAEEGWNALVRALNAVGYGEQAAGVVKRRLDVAWQDGTLAGLRKGHAAQSIVETQRTPVLAHLPRLVRSAYAARRAELKPKALASLLDELSIAKPSLAQRLVDRYEASLADESESTSRLARRGPAMAERLTHARMLACRDAGDHAGVVQRFTEAFHWIGTPDHILPIQAIGSETASDRSWMIPTRHIERKLYPTSVHLTTLYPSLLHLNHNTSGSGSANALSFVQYLRHALLIDSVATTASANADNASPLSGITAISADVIARPLAPRLLPLPTTFAVITRKICELYGPAAGLMLLDQNTELIGDLLSPLSGHGAATTSTDVATDANITATTPNERPKRRAKIALTPSENDLLALRVRTAGRLVPSIDVYNAVLWSLAGHGRTERLSSLLGDMYDEKPIASQAQRVLWRTYGPSQVDEEALDQLRMPRPDERTLLGIAGILEGVGKTEEAEKIRQLCRQSGCE
jgi:hypothetical protein